MDNQYIASFAEIDIQEFKYIRFMMPALDIGRTDIEISVEYGPSPKNPDMITANVWARGKDSSTKCFLYTEHIKATLVEKNGYEEIVMAINNNPSFYSHLHDYLAWATKNNILK